MTITTLLIVLLLAWLLAWFGRRRWSGTLVVIALALFLLVGGGLLPHWLIDQLQADYATRPVPIWAPRNAIVLLTGAQVQSAPDVLEPSLGSYARITETAVLYHDCRRARVICTVLVSGGDPDQFGTPLALVYGNLLQRLGVDAADVQLESASANTWENAKFTQPMLHAMAPVRIWLVTSGYHMHRAMTYFERFGITPVAVRADYIQVLPSWRPDARNFHVMDIALHEYLGLIRTRVYDAMGWNERITRSDPR